MAHKSRPEIYVLFERKVKPSDIIKYTGIPRLSVWRYSWKWNNEVRLAANALELKIKEGKK